jgi:heat shock protein beta
MTGQFDHDNDGIPDNMDDDDDGDGIPDVDENDFDIT